jgi:hypothetical protein
LTPPSESEFLPRPATRFEMTAANI